MKAQNEILTTAAATQAKGCVQASEAQAKLHADMDAEVGSMCGSVYAFLHNMARLRLCAELR